MNSTYLRRPPVRIGFGLIALLLAATCVFAQGGYYINGPLRTLPDATFNEAAIPLFVPVNREDVKAIGMGKTQVANGLTFNAMMYNPALLATPKTSIEAFTVQASIPPQTLDAALYFKDHIGEFRQALSLTKVKDAAKNLSAAGATLAQMLAALQDIQDGMRFPRDLLTTVVGPSENPKTHGFRVIPAVSAQIGNFGFSLFGTVQSGFQVIQSATLDALLKVKIPPNLNDQTQINAAVQAAADLLTILNAVTDPITGTINIKEAYPVTFSVSHIDIVGAAGYGYRLTKNIDLGANIKIINRRFSTKIVQTNNVDDIWSEVRGDFDASATGFTFDLGGRYHFDFGLDAGLSLQNIIPVQKITSTVSGTFVASGYDYDLDNLGRKQINGVGDTAVVPVAQRQTIHQPIDLKLPFIMNAGTRYAITREWDVAFDIADIAAQDERFENYGQRFRLGTEYRLDAIKDVLGIAPRLGYADSRLTFGVGLNLFRFIQIDGAYAVDSFIQERSYFAQLRIGW